MALGTADLLVSFIQWIFSLLLVVEIGNQKFRLEDGVAALARSLALLGELADVYIGVAFMACRTQCACRGPTAGVGFR